MKRFVNNSKTSIVLKLNVKSQYLDDFRKSEIKTGNLNID